MKNLFGIVLFIFISTIIPSCMQMPQTSPSEPSGDYYFFTFSKAHIDDPLDQQQRAEDSSNMIADQVGKLDDQKFPKMQKNLKD